ncbi:MAG TPA: class I SAM-dependent methyltransferase [Burkholderiales bacterium]|nr:class I SAM-dependent methyltransferase [Burkholderiales bacterium]
MSDRLETLKADLESFGEAHDAATAARNRRMFNITRDTGQLLAILVRATAARRVLEIGTSNGYSTLWLAEAAKAIEGSVTTVEVDAYKIKLASTNFARSGLASFITQVHEDAGRFLNASEEGAYDLVFLDSERSEYTRWWHKLRRVLRPGGLLVVDNATSHVEELAPLRELMMADGDFAGCLIPIGKGEYVAVRTST